MPLFRVLGLSGSSVQFSPVQSAWCAFACGCVLHLFHAFLFIWFYFLWLLFVFAFYSYIAAKSKSVPSACSCFPLERFSSFRLFNTCILTLMLQSFTTYYGHLIAGFEFAALEPAYFSSRPGKPANMVFVGVGPWVQSFSGLSSIPETSTRKPSCAAPSKASIGPEGISAESSSGGKVSLFSPVFTSVVSNVFFFGSTLPSGFCSMAART